MWGWEFGWGSSWKGWAAQKQIVKYPYDSGQVTFDTAWIWKLIGQDILNDYQPKLYQKQAHPWFGARASLYIQNGWWNYPSPANEKMYLYAVNNANDGDVINLFWTGAYSYPLTFRNALRQRRDDYVWSYQPLHNEFWNIYDDGSPYTFTFKKPYTLARRDMARGWWYTIGTQIDFDGQVTATIVATVTTPATEIEYSSDLFQMWQNIQQYIVDQLSSYFTFVGTPIYNNYRTVEMAAWYKDGDAGNTLSVVSTSANLSLSLNTQWSSWVTVPQFEVLIWADSIETFTNFINWLNSERSTQVTATDLWSASWYVIVNQSYLSWAASNNFAVSFPSRWQTTTDWTDDNLTDPNTEIYIWFDITETAANLNQFFIDILWPQQIAELISPYTPGNPAVYNYYVWSAIGVGAEVNGQQTSYIWAMSMSFGGVNSGIDWWKIEIVDAINSQTLTITTDDVTPSGDTATDTQNIMDYINTNFSSWFSATLQYFTQIEIVHLQPWVVWNSSSLNMFFYNYSQTSQSFNYGFDAWIYPIMLFLWKLVSFTDDEISIERNLLDQYEVAAWEQVQPFDIVLADNDGCVKWYVMNDPVFNFLQYAIWTVLTVGASIDFVTKTAWEQSNCLYIQYDWN